VFRRARVVGPGSKADTDKPVAVFLGKARLGDTQSAGVRGESPSITDTSARFE